MSNHGGRQLDYTFAALRALPEIAAEAGGMAVMLDGGIRRGTDVIKALALGAHFVFVGRPFLYAAAVGGEAGVQRAITLLRTRSAAIWRCSASAASPRSRRIWCGSFDRRMGRAQRNPSPRRHGTGLMGFASLCLLRTVRHLCSGWTFASMSGVRLTR